jgi:PadR family transcriptional regulator, regulatory protein PadR
MRRKAGSVLGLEQAILAAGSDLRATGTPEFYGFLIAKELKEHEEARLLTAHGTLYKALDRMERAGWLASRWEDRAEAAGGRPLRRLYRVTAEGNAALAAARQHKDVAPRATRLAEA